MATNVYIRLKDGFAVRKSIQSINSLLFKDGVAEVQLEDGKIGIVSKNMARRIYRFRPEVLHKHSHNALIEWLKSD